MMTIKEYIDQVTSMKTYGKTTLYIDFTHLSDHSGDLAASLIADYYRWDGNLSVLTFQLVKRAKSGLIIMLPPAILLLVACFGVEVVLCLLLLQIRVCLATRGAAFC